MTGQQTCARNTLTTTVRRLDAVRGDSMTDMVAGAVSVAACCRRGQQVLPFQVLVRGDNNSPRRLILKWNLEKNLPMEGRASARVLELIRELRQEGRL
jgi:hypothetical protein